MAGIGAQISLSKEMLETVNLQTGSKATTVLKLHLGSWAFFPCLCQIVDGLASWKLLNLSNQQQGVSPVLRDDYSKTSDSSVFEKIATML